ncbi:hypothetical protein GCM10009760_21190 [Kitasatospora kazusensis]|uniref:GNAT family N-acetyltransferase n=1 Tax=Kitasatospora kazusensis TaxID=407974 RepID=A0ABN2ZAC2_9ACTN
MNTLKTVESHVDLEHFGWDGLLGHNDYYQSVQWLSYVELLDSPYWRYLVAGPSGGPARAGLTVHQINSTASPFNRPDARLRLAVERLGGPVAAPFWGGLEEHLLPALALGGRTIGHSRVLLDAAEPEPVRRARLRELLAEAEELAVVRGLRSLSALYVDEHDRLLREELTAAGYLAFPNGAASHLRIDFEDFEGYLARFSPRRRRLVRREHHHVRSQVEFTVGPLDEESAPTIAELGAANSRRYGWDVSTAAALLPHQLTLRAIPGVVETLTARDGAGRTLGALAFIQWRDEMYARQIGFDYERIGDLPLYFELGFYRLIEEALSRGVRLIDYSIEKNDTKLSRGCAELAKYGYLKCLDGEVHTLLGRALDGLRRHGDE